ncbi:hypothetical protein D3C75_1058090 [compost metagenome]
MGDGKRAVGAGALGVDDALGDAFAVEVGKFFNEPEIFQQGGTARAGRQGVVVVRYWGARGGSQRLLVGHGTLPKSFLNGAAQVAGRRGVAAKLRQTGRRREKSEPS